MSYRKNLVGAVFFGVAVFASVTFVPLSLRAQAGRSAGSVTFPFRVVDSEASVVRGQDEPVDRKSPSLLDRLKRTWVNITRDNDDDPGSPVRNREAQRDPAARPPQAVQMTPPKAVTSQDLQHAIDHPDAPDVKRPPAPAATPSAAPRDVEQPGGMVRDSGSRENSTEISRAPQSAGSSNYESTLKRMQEMREGFFEPVPFENLPVPSPSPQPSPKPVPLRTQMDPKQGGTPTQSPPLPVDSGMFQEPPVSPTVSPLVATETGKETIFTPSSQATKNNQLSGEEIWGGDAVVPHGTMRETDAGIGLKEIGGIDVIRGPVAPWDRSPAALPDKAVETADLATDSQVDMVVPQRSPRNATTFTAEREKIAGPLIELEIVGSPKAIVGQETTYRIQVINRGGAPAEQVVLTVEIPNWIDVMQTDISAGTTSIIPRPNSDIRDFVWKIAKVDAKAEEQINLHLIPRQRETVDLKIRYDFHKPLAFATIAVQEPVLAMELQGPSEVLWGSKVNYKLLVRNTGNGDAENVKLELLQAGSDVRSCELPLLRAGEEQLIDVDVWTGKQDHVDINILATGPYDLSAKAVKRITVMRPELSIEVDSPEMLFVGNPAEYSVRVRNVGGATAKNVELAASIPLGAKHVSNTAGGRLTPQNQVLWSVDTIPSGGEFVATIVCEMKREGACRLEVAANDKNGLLASGSGSVNVEAIADLKMQLESPQGPVEVGQEAIFLIHITNRGTKTAEDVEVVAAFARGLEPHAIEGANGTMLDGRVAFDKIPAISAGQTVTLKVKGRADRPGNLRTRAEVICQGVNAHLVYEQATFFFQKQKNKTSFIVETPGDSGMSSFDQPVPPQSIQKSTASLPLEKSEPTAAEQTTLAPLR